MAPSPVTVHRLDRRDWIDAAILTVFLWLTIVVLYLPVLLARHPGEGLSSAAIEGATVLNAIVCGLLIFRMHRLVEAAQLPVRIVVVSAAIVIAAAFQTLVDFAFTYWVAIWFKPGWTQSLPTVAQSYRPFFTYICLFAFNVTLLQLVLWRRQAALDRVRLAEALVATRQAEIIALRFQLNPHFLFNSLNAISSLIVTRRVDDAEEMTNRLADFLRQSLASDPAALVPLAAELATAEEYLEIESVRFGDRLLLDIDVSREAEAWPVPNLLLQPLIENAIKYGVARSAAPARIRIAARVDGRGLSLVVANDVPAGGVPQPGTGIGLANVRSRLEAVYGDRCAIDIRAEDQSFTVAIRIEGSAPGAPR